jgi:hypothetical protein
VDDETVARLVVWKDARDRRAPVAHHHGVARPHCGEVPAEMSFQLTTLARFMTIA